MESETKLPDGMSEPALSADQSAIADYFSSSEFQWAKTARKKTKGDGAGDARVLRAWTLELEREDGLSVGIAFYGFAALWLLISIAVPYGVWFLGGFNGQSFGAWIVTVHLTFAPLLACLTLISVTSAMWYVPIVKRFAVAFAVVVPGLAMLMVGLAQLRWIDGDQAFSSTAYQALAFCVVSSSIVLPFQLWGGWSLSHARETPTPLPRLGTLQMMELTMIASIVFAIGVSARDDQVWKEMLTAAGIASVCTVAALSTIVTRLNMKARSKFVGFVVAIAFSFAAMMATGLYGFSRFDETVMWLSKSQQWTIVLGSTVIGTLLFFSVLHLGQWWLRACGWQCVDSLPLDRHG